MNMRKIGAAGLLAVASLLGSCGQPAPNATSQPTAVVAEPFWPVAKPVDSSLNRSHALHGYFRAAQAKDLPLNYFRDLIAANARISLRYADWPSFQPSGAGGTIYHPKIGTSFDQWYRGDWSSFYNELFHAWWNAVFLRSATYANDRATLLTASNDRYYRRAHPTNPRLAQEEGYSETIATLMIYLYPIYSPALGGNGYYELSHYVYDRNRTVAAVGHGDRPGYRPEAEETYLTPAEYAVVFRQLVDALPPSAQ